MKVSATLDIRSTGGGYLEGASSCGSTCASVTTMKIAKTASSTITIADWTRSIELAPAMLTTATASTTAVANTLLHAGDEASPKKSAEP
jgi:multisubunit Na+/H+ antiporter MnhE subunit